MNELFVNVKVDREERPDVDDIYMQSVMAISGHGGWPMTVWLMPDGRPFFAGTYFPREGHGGRAGFVDVCRAVADAYRDRRPQVEEQAEQLVDAIAKRTAVTGGARGGSDDRRRHRRPRPDLRPEWGGFGRSPKFPQPSYLELILQRTSAAPVTGRSDMATTTLDAMASGGMYDHLGGGFARYSVDRLWLVPHFEKMLYDQAGLLRLYTHGWQVTGNPAWRQVCEEIVEYVLRDLAQPEGGISSAEDADSEGEEGRFYVWSQGRRRAHRRTRWRSPGTASPTQGNFEGDEHPQSTGARRPAPTVGDGSRPRRPLRRTGEAGAARSRRQGPHGVERDVDLRAGRGRRRARTAGLDQMPPHEPRSSSSND